MSQKYHDHVIGDSIQFTAYCAATTPPEMNHYYCGFICDMVGRMDVKLSVYQHGIRKLRYNNVITMEGRRTSSARCVLVENQLPGFK